MIKKNKFILRLASIATLAAILIGLSLWSRSSPKFSFALFKLGLISNYSPLIQMTCDREKLTARIVDQIAPFLIQSPNGQQIDATLSPEAKATKQIMLKALEATLPIFVTSAKEIAHATSPATSDATNLLIPVLLQIPPQNWQEWTKHIAAGEFHLGECNVQGSRAACELIFQGPQDKSATIAVLWERPSWLWQIKGVIGIDQLIAAMR